jgi:Uma2 family endonuclease
MASQPNILLTAEEYLALEEKAEYKSEYFDGEMFAMSGVSLPHDTIVGNIFATLHNQLKGGPCRAHTSDMRVAASTTRAYVYPDVSIACKDAKYIRRGTDNLLNPVAIIEVLSPTTEPHDRGKKFQWYKGIASLKEYVLVSQDEVLVERFLRQDAGGDWLYSSFTSLDDSLVLGSAPATLKLRDLYDGVFPSAGATVSEETA